MLDQLKSPKPRDQEIVLSHDMQGKTYEQLAAEYGITENRIYAIMKSARHHVKELELELLKSTKTDDVVGFAIPYGPDRAVAMAYLEWVKYQLAHRGVKVKVEHRPTRERSIFFLSDVTQYISADGGNSGPQPSAPGAASASGTHGTSCAVLEPSASRRRRRTTRHARSS